MKKAILLISILAASLLARSPDFNEFFALQESLSRVHPRMRTRWLSQHGVDLGDLFEPKKPEGTGLRLVGKWGRGPAYEVTGRDSLIFLSLGSEVAILNFANPDSPRVVLEVQASGLVVQAAVRDSFLYIGVGSGAAGFEVWNIENPALPVFRGRALTRLSDFCIKDTFAYITSRMSSPSCDTFKVFNLVDPANPRLIGFCPDSGDAVTVSGNTVIQGDWNDIHAIDVSDPTNPHRVGSYPGGPLGIASRGNICCAAIYWTTDEDHFRFEVLDISTPSSVRRLGYLNDVGGYDIYLAESLAFVSGFQSSGYEFTIINIADSTYPALLGTCVTPGENAGVWADLSRRRVYLADRFRGVAEIDISNLNSPQVDTGLLMAGVSSDVDIDGDLACVANDGYGMVVLDISNPCRPVQLGALDSTMHIATRAVAVRDSFAYMGYSPSLGDLHSIDISDPAHPERAGGVNLFNWPEDLVLCDSFLYVAEAYRFQVVNIARPRQPVLVGSCVIQGTGVDLLLCETLAYVSSLPTQIINVRDPVNPVVVGTIPTYGHGIAIQDTFAFMPALYDSMVIYNVSNPIAPVRVARHTFSGGHVWNSGIALVDTLLYVGGDLLHILDISDPLTPREVGIWIPPYDIRRLLYAEPYLYAACYEAGVCVLETTQVGVKETQRTRHREKISVVPSITSGVVWLSIDGGLERIEIVEVYNATGIKLKEIRKTNEPGLKHIKVDLSKDLAGVYIVRLRAQNKIYNSRVVKTKGR